MKKRLARLNEQLRRELSELIRTRVRDPRVGLVTITGVEVAADLGSARVYVRITGGRDEVLKGLEGLTAAGSFLRGELGRVLHVRRVPEHAALFTCDLRFLGRIFQPSSSVYSL